MEPVLNMLLQNARLSTYDIGQVCNISEEEVESMIAYYEESGIIVGYRPIIDMTKLKPPRVAAMIEVKTNPKKDIGFDGVVDILLAYEEVESVYLMAGEYDLAVYVVGETMMDVANFVSRKCATLEGVVSTSTHFVLEKYKELGFNFKKTIDPREKMSV